jgi:hypothetical protein
MLCLPQVVPLVLRRSELVLSPSKWLGSARSIRQEGLRKRSSSRLLRGRERESNRVLLE